MGKRLLLCLLAACGGGGSVSIDDLGPELAKVSCSKTFECCSAAEVMDQFDGFTVNGEPITTEEQCESFFSAFIDAFATQAYNQSLAQGRIEYDGDQARACLDAAANLGCAAYDQIENADQADCDKPFLIPQVADGGGCTQSYECISGYCDGATVDPEGSDTDGTCKQIPTEGQDCTSRCAQGLHCAYDTTAMKETCQPLLPNGSTCTSDFECASDHCDTTCSDKPPVCDGN